MTQDEFVRRAVGLPWKRWRSDWQACDCFGLVALYHKEVLGADLGAVPQTDIASGFKAASEWLECGPDPGTTAFMCWRFDAPTHCGMLLDGGLLLHAQEGRPIAETGSTRVTSLLAMQRCVPDLRFYRYTGAASC